MLKRLAYLTKLQNLALNIKNICAVIQNDRRVQIIMLKISNPDLCWSPVHEISS